ncbi:DUF2269 domain-containing protein [Allonocardiopsis opalescens]|uniref:DUF2269 domain-containing protein n=1 Tax=Allonocardiopsis opalescens TaxID=1144618 RepID=A0A2T0PW07_9ACTN|nr:DUF2269 domain-containing protein [Allonocardiopsis opalescens]PRX95713.1 hypothetical protein CLV72_109324 [Allonocardiopsis opalescens]
MAVKTLPTTAAPAASRAPRFRLPRPARRLLLTLHVGIGVGWIGLEAGVLTLLLTALNTGDTELARAAMLAVGAVADPLLVPTAVLTFATGVVLSLGTQWGLVRYYWVAVKLVLSTALLFGSSLAINPRIQRVAAEVAAAGPEVMPVSDAVLVSMAGATVVPGLLVIAATALSVYKPWGRTPLGRR